MNAEESLPRLALIMPARVSGIGGVQRFADSLLGALQQVADVEPIWLHPAAGVARTLPSWLVAAGGGLARLHRLHRVAPLTAVVSTFHGPLRLLPGVPMAGFVHDLRAWNLHGSKLALRQRFSPSGLVLHGMLRTWDLALAPSAHVARDVRRLVPSLRVVNVGEGLDHLDDHRSTAGVERDLVLVIAGRAPHKRGELGLEVLEGVVERLGCRGVVIGATARVPRSDRIEVVSPSDAELVRLYERARVAIVPTSYEGFGLAAGEALRHGAPVVFASDCPLHELVGLGGLGVRPDRDEMVAAVLRIAEDPGLFLDAARAAAEPFTWRRTAERILTAIGEARLVRSTRGSSSPKAGRLDQR